MDSQGEEIRLRWQEKAERMLPPESETLARNCAVTSVYARLYLANPKIFKWAGMAAFASHRVGVALLTHNLACDNRLMDTLKSHFGLDLCKSGTIHELEMLRITNNRIYADAVWPHLAYADPEGGIEAVVAGLKSAPGDHGLQIEGFRKIDEGKRKMAGDEPGAQESIWTGNALLLKHEQTVIAQPTYEQLNFKPGDFLRNMRKLQWPKIEQNIVDVSFGVFLTTMASIDFMASNLYFDPRYRTSFLSFMCTLGLWQLLLTTSWPDLTRKEQRWYWCEHRIIPIWKRAEEFDARLPQKLLMLVQSGGARGDDAVKAILVGHTS